MTVSGGDAIGGLGQTGPARILADTEIDVPGQDPEEGGIAGGSPPTGSSANFPLFLVGV